MRFDLRRRLSIVCSVTPERNKAFDINPAAIERVRRKDVESDKRCMLRSIFKYDVVEMQGSECCEISVDRIIYDSICYEGARDERTKSVKYLRKLLPSRSRNFVVKSSAVSCGQF